MFGWVADGFRQRAVVGGLDNNGQWGPTGLALAGDGALLIANYHDGNLFRVDSSASSRPVVFAGGIGAVGLQSISDGNLAATRMAHHEVVIVDGVSGEITRRYPCPFGGPVGVAADPVSGRLLVTLLREHALAWLDLERGTWALAHRGDPLDRPDGLAFDAAGHAYVGSVGNDQVVRLHSDGSVEAIARIAGEPDGIAMVPSGWPVPSGVLVNGHDGRIHRLEQREGVWHTVLFAEGGTRGDHMAVGPNGAVYVTQTDEIVEIAPA